MVTSEDVAKRAGVSRATVSYVLNGKHTISEGTRARVLKAMKELSYFPNANARSLVGKRSDTLVVLASIGPGTDASGLFPFIAAVTGEARKRGGNVMLLPADEGMGMLRRLAGESQAAGAFMLDVRIGDGRLAEAEQLPIPVVLIGNPMMRTELCAVDVDYHRVVDLAIEELRAVGVRQVVTVSDVGDGADQYGAAKNVFWFQEVFERYGRLAAEMHGLEFDFHGLANASSGAMRPLREQMRSWRPGDGHGMLVRTPGQAEWAMQLLLSVGLEPGRDVPVVAVCEDEDAQSMLVPVTNVSPMTRVVSKTAVSMMYDLLDGKAAPKEVRMVYPKLVRRASTIAAFEIGRHADQL